MSVSKAHILERLRRVKGPDLEGNIVDLGLVSDVFLSDGKAYFSITVPAERAKTLDPMRAAAEKVVREPTLAARLRFLNRGQEWVIRRLDGLLGETLPASVSDFLVEMRTRHRANIEACDRMAESLP